MTPSVESLIKKSPRTMRSRRFLCVVRQMRLKCANLLSHRFVDMGRIKLRVRDVITLQIAHAVCHENLELRFGLYALGEQVDLIFSPVLAQTLQEIAMARRMIDSGLRASSTIS